MPEGDTVYRTCQRLHEALAGHRVTLAELRWPSLATARLEGRTVTDVTPRGKHILMHLSGEVPLTLHSHLRMEGSWRIDRAGERRPSSHVRAIIGNAEWVATGHKLGMLDLVATSKEHHLVGHLGPDVLGPSWDLSKVVATMATNPSRPIGIALLDQRVLAGVGTVYMTESLFLHGVTPWTPTRDVNRLDSLVQRIHAMLWAGTRGAVRSSTGSTRAGEQTYVHGRNNKPCRRCGTLVRLRDLGADHTARVAYFCPTCQKGPFPA